MPGPIAEAKVEEGARRVRIPSAVKSYLKLEGGETIEFLSASTEITYEELEDNCLIIHVKRR